MAGKERGRMEVGWEGARGGSKGRVGREGARGARKHWCGGGWEREWRKGRLDEWERVRKERRNGRSE